MSSIMIIVLEVVVAVALGVCLWSVVRSAMRSAREKNTKSREQRLTSVCVAVVTVVLLVVTFLLGSSAPLIINGLPYDDGWWLRVADMFVASTCVMLFLAAAAVVVGRVWSRRVRTGARGKGQGARG